MHAAAIGSYLTIAIIALLLLCFTDLSDYPWQKEGSNKQSSYKQSVANLFIYFKALNQHVQLSSLRRKIGESCDKIDTNHKIINNENLTHFLLLC